MKENKPDRYYTVGITKIGRQFMALSPTESKRFNDLKGATAWLLSRGFAAHGKKISTAGITKLADGGYSTTTDMFGCSFLNPEEAETWLGDNGYGRVVKSGTYKPCFIVIYGEKIPYNCTREELNAALNKAV